MNSVSGTPDSIRWVTELNAEGWFDERPAILQTIINQLSDSETPTFLKELATEHLYRLRSRRLMSPLSFATNLMLYSLTCSKTAADIYGKFYRSGSYSAMKLWLKNLSMELLPFTKADTLFAFDNDEIIHKRWSVQVENKSVPVLTIICQKEVHPDGTFKDKRRCKAMVCLLIRDLRIELNFTKKV